MTIEYILIGILYVLGVGFHISQKLKQLQQKFPSFTERSIKRTFIRHEFNLFVSYLLGLGIVGAVWLLKNEAYIHLSQPVYGCSYVAILIGGYYYSQILWPIISVTDGIIEIKDYLRKLFEKENANPT